MRGVCFHNQQPLFVSGGDDYKIKVIFPNILTVLMILLFLNFCIIWEKCFADERYSKDNFDSSKVAALLSKTLIVIKGIKYDYYIHVCE